MFKNECYIWLLMKNVLFNLKMKNMVVNHVIKMSVQIYETITCDPSQYFQFIFVLFFSLVV